MKKTITLLLLFTITLANLGGGYELTEKEKRVQRQALIHWSRVETIRQSEFTSGLMVEYMELIGLKHIEVVYRQAILETGWFRSSVFNSLNNIFGMHYPSTRGTTASGWVWGDRYGGRHAKVSKYNHWTESVDDYKLWQDYWASESYDQTNYYAFLGNVGYAAGVNYIRTLKRI